MVFLNRNFFRSSSSHETSSKQTRKPRIWRQNYRRLSFLCNAHALLTNPLRCPDTNRIRVDGRIRFVYATCGRRYFCIRIKKFADTKITGYMWTGPKTLLKLKVILASSKLVVIVDYRTAFNSRLTEERSRRVWKEIKLTEVFYC